MATIGYIISIKRLKRLKIAINEKDFQYPGPKPFSKETAILMMSDSVEAASKSLREPSVDKIDQFVNTSLINKLMKNSSMTVILHFQKLRQLKKYYLKNLLIFIN